MMTAKQDTARESLGWWQGFCGTSTPADVRNNRRLVVATVVWVLAFLASLVVVKPFLAVIRRRGFAPFAWYRILAGIMVLAGVATGWFA